MIVPQLKNSPKGWIACLFFARSKLLYLYLDWGCRCGVLTVEIEHVDVATLEKLEQQGVDCQPKASTIRIIQVFCLFPEASTHLMIITDLISG